ncbi:hypothetical protein RIF29_29680 [Crotalaria pallida]|uniref:Uncharacterized protein n=1 Tax=Crotalaria pallida TaxID=3830 RepID=A0AAN9I0L9_CROPI
MVATSSSIQDPAFSGAVNNEKPHAVDVELTNKDSGFGPWMLAKNPSRRRSFPKSEGKNIVEFKADMAGSRFDALQNEIVNEVNVNSDPKNVDVMGDVGHGKMGQRFPPKAKQQKGSGPKQSQRQGITKPKMVIASRDNSTSQTQKFLEVKDKAAVKAQEEEILRIMSRKQQEMWKPYKEGKLSDSFMEQFAYTPSKEVLHFVSASLQKEHGKLHGSCKPSDPRGASGPIADGVSLQTDVEMGRPDLRSKEVSSHAD